MTLKSQTTTFQTYIDQTVDNLYPLRMKTAKLYKNGKLTKQARSKLSRRLSKEKMKGKQRQQTKNVLKKSDEQSEKNTICNNENQNNQNIATSSNPSDCSKQGLSKKQKSNEEKMEETQSNEQYEDEDDSDAPPRVLVNQRKAAMQQNKDVNWISLSAYNQAIAEKEEDLYKKLAKKSNR